LSRKFDAAATMDHHDPGGTEPVNAADIAARIADDVVDTMLSAAGNPEWWGGPVVTFPLGRCPVIVGVVDVEPDALDEYGTPTWNDPEALFHGWREILDRFARAADDARRGRPNLRLLLPSSVIVGGLRPHDQPRQAFRADWVVGAPNVDRAVRLLWNHGRELVELASPAVVVGGDRFRAGAGGRAVGRLVRWCHQRDVCVGFGGVDLGTWAVSGVRTADRLKHAGDRTSPLREVVELVEHELRVNHAKR
jgi:hypothetical protein